MTRALAAVGALLVACAWAEADTGPARVGSKSFTESYLLAEIAASEAPAETAGGEALAKMRRTSKQ